MLENAKWILPQRDMKDIAPLFFTEFSAEKPVAKATLAVTGLGIYTAKINGENVTDTVLNPGCVQYPLRHQYQEFDVTALLKDNNRIEILLAAGWLRGWLSSVASFKYHFDRYRPKPIIIAQLDITFTDGSTKQLVTDASWQCSESPLRYCTLYDGEEYDANIPCVPEPVALYAHDKNLLIPQEGEWIKEQEVFTPVEIITTPKGETVLDFGQEITGYVEFSADAKKGDKILLTCAEVLDSEGNFYTDNYRRAMSKMEYICCDGFQTHKPQHTFYGFRYIRVNEYPGKVKAENFKAITVHSEMTRTGYFDCSDPLLNRWFLNTVWSQKGNFLDIPTDCPQRNERLGWLGDIQAFIRTGSYHFDIQKFITKWLRDVKLSQAHNGCVPDIVPDVFMEHGYGKAAWADAITICPWQLYETYADTAILQEMYAPMKKWVDYITQVTVEPYTWSGSNQLGDWLALDCPDGEFKGSSRDDLLASAYYAKSTQIVADTAKLLGYTEDAAQYQALYENIRSKFQDTYNDTFETQTECVLALHFGLCKDPQKTGDRLAELVKQWGYMTTGFMGAPWLLHALSATGHSDVAWDLILRTEYPSWLYSVTKGATTIWEHLDSLKPDGSFWSPVMNSFNHYAFGAAAAWLYEWAAGIQPAAPGFAKARIMPQATKQLRHLAVEMDTRAGKISSSWEHTENGCVYKIVTPVEAELFLPGKHEILVPGSYTFCL